MKKTTSKNDKKKTTSKDDKKNVVIRTAIKAGQRDPYRGTTYPYY